MTKLNNKYTSHDYVDKKYKIKLNIKTFLSSNINAIKH